LSLGLALSSARPLRHQTDIHAVRRRLRGAGLEDRRRPPAGQPGGGWRASWIWLSPTVILNSAAWGGRLNVLGILLLAVF
jgi:hypothetical protein